MGQLSFLLNVLTKLNLGVGQVGFLPRRSWVWVGVWKSSSRIIKVLKNSIQFWTVVGLRSSFL